MTAEARPAGRPDTGADTGVDTGAAPGAGTDALRQRVAALEQALAEARQARDAGRASEDRFRALFDMNRDGIVFVDLEGHIEEMNQAYLDLVGYDRDEIGKHTYQDLTPEKWRAEEADIIEIQVMRRGFSDEYEKEYVRKDGSIAPISLRTILVRDLEGRPIRFMGIVRDITELKEKEEALKASEKRYRSLFDLSHDGVVFASLDGPIEEANGAYLDMLGYDSERARRPDLPAAHAGALGGDGSRHRRGSDPQPRLFGRIREGIHPQGRLGLPRRPPRHPGTRRGRPAPAAHGGRARHHRAEAGEGGAGAPRPRPRPLERGARAVRLCRVPRPAGAAPQDSRLRRPPRGREAGEPGRGRPPVHRIHDRRRGGGCRPW